MRCEERYDDLQEKWESAVQKGRQDKRLIDALNRKSAGGAPAPAPARNTRTASAALTQLPVVRQVQVHHQSSGRLLGAGRVLGRKKVSHACILVHTRLHAGMRNDGFG